jgi:D-alanyl-D-alanine carboxypeptidase
MNWRLNSRLFVFLITLILLFLVKTANSYSNEPPGSDLAGITATSYILIDARTGIVIAEKNADEERPIASLTKIMTSLIALSEARNLNTTITATYDCSNAGESEIYIEPGDKFKFRELLCAVMLKSANDAADLVAQAVGGRKEVFLGIMNRKAKELELKHTHFANPHGLDSKNHFSSARDIAVIAMTAMAYPEFRKIVATKEATVTWLNKPRYFKLRNHNKLLHKYPFIRGIKTGYTRRAGHCLATYADFGDIKLIAVVLNSKSPQDCYSDSLKLVNYGKSRLKRVKIASRNETLPVIYTSGENKYKVKAYSDIFAVLPVDEGYRARLSFEFIPTMTTSGKNLYGILKVFYSGKLIAVSTGDALISEN